MPEPFDIQSQNFVQGLTLWVSWKLWPTTWHNDITVCHGVMWHHRMMAVGRKDYKIHNAGGALMLGLWSQVENFGPWCTGSATKSHFAMLFKVCIILCFCSVLKRRGDTKKQNEQQLEPIEDIRRVTIVDKGNQTNKTVGKVEVYTSA